MSFPSCGRLLRRWGLLTCSASFGTWVLMFLGCARPAILDEPHLVGRPPDVRLVLPARMSLALERTGREFETLAVADFDSSVVGGLQGLSYVFAPNQAPFAVIGDFDGDRHWDVALLQQSADEGRFVIVLDRESTPIVREVSRWQLRPQTIGEKHFEYLVRVAPGAYEIPTFAVDDSESEPQSLALENDAVESINSGKGARVYYFVDGRLETILTAD